jgi:2-amino-4-hydroxy-6-hydroxymethyldihydropteridine diphosphokinase
VALVDTNLSALALLRLLKQIEAAAGRRGGKPWGPRTLDLDLLDYKGLVLNWARIRPAQPRPGARPLSLPHPQLESRAFVLKPLLDVAPDWRHPVTKESIAELWHGVSKRGQGRVLKRIS